MTNAMPHLDDGLSPALIISHLRLWCRCKLQHNNHCTIFHEAWLDYSNDRNYRW